MCMYIHLCVCVCTCVCVCMCLLQHPCVVWLVSQLEQSRTCCAVNQFELVVCLSCCSLCRETSLVTAMVIIQSVSRCVHLGMDESRGIHAYACVKLRHWLVKLLLIPVAHHIWRVTLLGRCARNAIWWHLTYFCYCARLGYVHFGISLTHVH